MGLLFHWRHVGDATFRQLALVRSSFPLAASVAAALAGTPLSGEQLKQLAAGNTISLHSIAKGKDFKNFMSADGVAFSLNESSGKTNQGTWRISESGAWCVKWNGAEERCGQVIDNGDGTYNRLEDGELRSVWKSIAPGNTIAK